MFRADYGGWKCTDCDYYSAKKSNVHKHVESKHVETQYYPCNFCGKVFKGINSYNVHLSNVHRK